MKLLWVADDSSVNSIKFTVFVQSPGGWGITEIVYTIELLNELFIVIKTKP